MKTKETNNLNQQQKYPK